MDTPDSIDLDAYLRRTGHAPVATPTLPALRSLAAAHVATIAFENLNPFVTGLVAARAIPGRRLALRNREFAVHTTGGGTERRALADAAQIRDVLQEEFLIRLPDHTQLQQRLDALPRAGTA